MWPRWLITLVGCAAAAHLRAEEQVEYEGGLYHVQRIKKADLAKLDLRWKGKDGKPLANFEGLRKELADEGKEIAFATNAGIYGEGPKPCGLLVCQGREEVPLNLQEGEGNFFLKPNGVFFIDDAGIAGIMEAAEYGRIHLKPRIATQSGPLMLRNGVIHPAFNLNSPNKRQRSAVGVRSSDGEVIFALCDREDRVKGRVTFHQMSRFFLHLGCRDALYLDGDISEMVTNPPPDGKFAPNTFAGMFVVAKQP
jgi:uncharacterized protein YigE (DUF2233 family)